MHERAQRRGLQYVLRTVALLERLSHLRRTFELHHGQLHILCQLLSQMVFIASLLRRARCGIQSHRLLPCREEGEYQSSPGRLTISDASWYLAFSRHGL